MKRPFYLLALIIALIAASCSESHKAAKRKQHNDSTTLRLALMPTLDCLPFYMAADSGIFDSLGLDVEIKTYRSLADCDTALMGGTVHCALTDLIYALRHADTTDLRLIMQTQSQWQLVTTRTARLRTVADMKERTVAIARHSATDMLSDEFMKGTKLTHDDVFRPQVGDIVLRSQMLTGGQVDAALLPEPHATRAVLLQHPSVYNSRQAEICLTAMAALQPTINARLKQMRLLVEAYNIAARRINAAHGNGRQLRSLLTSRTAIEPEVADTLRIPQFGRARSVSTDDLRRAQQWAAGSRLKVKADKLGTMVNSDFLN
ncbi:MAG: ABC transporter substrate-binding protein [Bacteroidaceae bacterium]|nr:ABC transporter substrate-binding protein [Bacteroidaceae bacterium]